MQPIGSFLTGKGLRLAELQDYVIDIIYDRFQPDALLYGGTAIWRCFGGARFSDNIDIYMETRSFDNLISSLEKYGLRLLWRDPEFPTIVRIANNETELLLETKEGYAENEITAYSRTDGSTKTISVLSPTELMVGKIEAYLNRKFIRDIYDLFVLTNWLDKQDYLVRTRFSEFLEDAPRPVDEQVLASLLYSGGKNLNFANMIAYIKRWINEI